VALVLGAASFCALGVAVASLIADSEAAPAVAQLVLFPLLFVSGTYLPIYSAALNRVAGRLPFNEALMAPFARHAGADWRRFAVLAAWGCAARWLPSADSAGIRPE
jgi:ABC-2 type transport system permease protein